MNPRVPALAAFLRDRFELNELEIWVASFDGTLSAKVHWNQEAAKVSHDLAVLLDKHGWLKPPYNRALARSLQAERSRFAWTIATITAPHEGATNRLAALIETLGCVEVWEAMKESGEFDLPTGFPTSRDALALASELAETNDLKLRARVLASLSPNKKQRDSVEDLVDWSGAAIADPESSPGDLILIVRPDGELHRVEARLASGHGPVVQRGPFSSAEVRAAVSEVLEELIKGMFAHGLGPFEVDRRVFVVLPMDHLCLDADRLEWKRETPEGVITHWQLLRTGPVLTIPWRAPCSPRWDDDWKWPEQTAWLADRSEASQLACWGLAESSATLVVVHTDEPDRHPPLLAYAAQVGVPVAVASRVEGFDRTAVEVLLSPDPRTFDRRVHDHRRSAPDSPWRDVTLMWNDPAVRRLFEPDEVG